MAGGGSGDGLKRLNYRVGKWDIAFARHVERLRAEKITILCGDLNCAHKVRICVAAASNMWRNTPNVVDDVLLNSEVMAAHHMPRSMCCCAGMHKPVYISAYLYRACLPAGD